MAWFLERGYQAHHEHGVVLFALILREINLQQLFNKKMWLLAVPLALFMAGCSGGGDNGAGGGGGGGAPPDTTAPTVSSTIPTAGATGVAINRNITVTFSEAMDAATVFTSFTLMQGVTLVPGAVTYVGTVATFDPTSDLAASTPYTATVTTGVKDLAGNPLAVTKTWSFNTGTAIAAGPEPVSLGTAGNFVILAKSGISTTGATAVTGDIGVSPIGYAAITGFTLIPTVPNGSNTFSTSALVTGQVFASDYTSPTPANLITAVSDMELAYTDAAGRTVPAPITELGAGEIGGLTLVPGLYKWSTGV